MDKVFLKNTLWVALSNGVVLLSSLLSGFVVPKVLGVTEYGYYQTFALYLSYTSLLHFGFVDGVLLKYAGISYECIDKPQFNTNTRFFIVMQLSITMLMSFVALFTMSGRSQIILLLISLDTLFINVTSYYQYVSQGTMRFKELSIRKLLQAIMKLLLVLLLLVCHFNGLLPYNSSYYYIVGICIIDLVLMVRYIYTYRDITFYRGKPFKNSQFEILELFKIGFILTIAYQVAHLVFILDRQFVVKLFDTDTYSLYAFAYSLVSMVTTIVGSISFVLFPTMKQKKNEDTIKFFDDWNSLISILVFFSLALYYFLPAFLNAFLPQYSASLSYVRIVFPGLALSCCITIIIFNFYKVFEIIKTYLFIGLAILLLSVLMNIGAYYLFHTPISISAASVISLFVWYIVAQLFFIKKYSTSPWKNILYLIILSSLFWVTTSHLFNVSMGLLVYLVLFFIVTIVMFGSKIKLYLRGSNQLFKG